MVTGQLSGMMIVATATDGWEWASVEAYMTCQAWNGVEAELLSAAIATGRELSTVPGGTSGIGSGAR
jgi:hypothetical protein